MDDPLVVWDNHALEMAMEPIPGDDVVYFGEYLAVLRRRKWWLIVSVVIGVVAAAAYYKIAPRSYTSTAKIQATIVLPSQSAGRQIDMPTEASFVTSNDVTKCASLLVRDKTFQADPSSSSVDPSTICTSSAIQATSLDRSPLQNLTVTPVPQSTVMTVEFSAPKPRQAEAGAQAFALAYIQIKTADGQTQLDKLRAPLLAQETADEKSLAKTDTDISNLLASISKNPPAPGQAGANQAKLNGLNQKRAVAQTALNQVTTQLLQLDPSKLTPPALLLPAQLPQAPSSPSKTIDGGIGLAVGILLGLALAFIVDKRDDHVRGRQDVETVLAAPVLAIIPHVQGWRDRDEAQLTVSLQPRGTVAEAYRQLRTSVAFLASQRNAKVIMVSGPGVGEGKTTTSANLAVVLALAGKRVILVSADLRKPRLHKFFGMDNDIGLSSILGEGAEPWSAMKNPAIENLRVIASGPVLANPAELVESERMPEFMDRLREVSDFVIIDSPPVLLVSDPLSIARAADGVLLVIDAHNSHRGALAAARDQLEQSGATILGAVMNNFDPARAKKYGSRYYGRYSPYGYRYSYAYGGYGYGGEPAPGNGARRAPREAPFEATDRGTQ